MTAQTQPHITSNVTILDNDHGANQHVTAMLHAIFQERLRQERLCSEGKFLWTCASPDQSDARKLAVLAEEFGEVAKEVTDQIIEVDKYAKEGLLHPPHRQAANRNRLRTELIQVAAVACAWAEALDAMSMVPMSQDPVRFPGCVCHFQNEGRFAAPACTAVHRKQAVGAVDLSGRLRVFQEPGILGPEVPRVENTTP